jgi:RHS repeat-associated protein
MCDIGHQGLQFDKEFGLYNNRARYYGPIIARFGSPDWLNRFKVRGGYQDGMSLYQFVRSSPLMLLDPFGFESGLTFHDHQKHSYRAVQSARNAFRAGNEGERWEQENEMADDVEAVMKRDFEDVHKDEFGGHVHSENEQLEDGCCRGTGRPAFGFRRQYVHSLQASAKA